MNHLTTCFSTIISEICQFVGLINSYVDHTDDLVIKKLFNQAHDVYFTHAIIRWTEIDLVKCHWKKRYSANAHLQCTCVQSQYVCGEPMYSH